MSDEESYELVMPFVATESNGGPFEDAAYAAGWEMGALAETLRSGSPFHSLYVMTENKGQVDLLAMRHGYSFETAGETDDYVLVKLTKELVS